MYRFIDSLARYMLVGRTQIVVKIYFLLSQPHLSKEDERFKMPDLRF